MICSNGKGHIKTIILLCIIIILIVIGLKFLKSNYNDAKVKTIKTNMSLIKVKANEYINKQKAEGKEIIFAGKKLSDVNDDEIINKIVANDIVKNEELEKYYMLTDENLAELGTNFTNEKDAYYLVNYETGEVVISSGIKLEKEKIVYKLSEMGQ